MAWIGKILIPPVCRKNVGEHSSVKPVAKSGPREHAVNKMVFFPARTGWTIETSGGG